MFISKNIIIFILIILFSTNIASAAWANESLLYETSLTITSGNIYQYNLTISNSSGTNTATTIYCNGHCNTNFTDLRFYIDNTTSLNYFFTDLSTGRVSVNVTNSGTLNIYYGNSTFSTENNSNATFWNQFFNFEGTTHGFSAGSASTTQKFYDSYSLSTAAGSNSKVISNSSIPYSVVQYVYLSATNQQFRIAYQKNTTNRMQFGVGVGCTAGHWCYSPDGISTATLFPTDTLISVGWSKLEYVINSNNTWNMYINNNQVGSGLSLFASAGTQSQLIYVRDDGNLFYIDGIYTRTNMSFPEPVLSSPVAEVSLYSNNYTNNNTLNFSVLKNSVINFYYHGNINNWYVDGVGQGCFGAPYCSPFQYTITDSTTLVKVNPLNGNNITWNVTGVTYPLQLLTPANGSTISSPVTLTWREWPLNAPHTYQIATDDQFINIVTTGTGTTGTTENITTTQSLSPGTYYWRVKNSTSAYTDWFNFTISLPTPTPGRLNISVFNESNVSQALSTYSVSLYGTDGSVLTKSTTTGWTNFSSSEIISQEYLIIVTPNSSYAQRMVLATSPTNVTMYLPSTTYTIYTVSFSLLDVTGLFPYRTSTISIIKNNTIMDKSYFGADGTHPVYMIGGDNYQIQIQNGNSVWNYGTYIPVASGTSTLTINNFLTNTTALNPFQYNFTYNDSEVVLNWNDVGSVMSNLNFTVHQGIPMTQICQLITSVNVGQSICTIDNTTQYHVIFSALMDDGTYQNSSFYIDYTYGRRKDSSVTSPITGLPIGTGYKWNYGTFTMPDWIYNWISLVFIIVLIASFGGYHSGMGGIISLIIAILLEGWGFFRPLGNSDPNNYITMGMTGGLLLLTIIYYLQHKDKGG